MAASFPVLVAVPDPWEGTLVTTLDQAPALTVLRRCADLAELLATAGTGRAAGAFVSPDLPGLDRPALQRLHNDGLAVVAVLPPGTPHADPGIIGAAVVADATAQTCEEALAQGAPQVRAHALADPARALVPATAGPAREPVTGPGRVVAVWGPVGSPGRTSVAIGLAEDLGWEHPALLVDADTYGPSVAQTLGVLDEAPGLAAACRVAETGVLGPADLSRRAPFVGRSLRVLTGLTRPDRWPELSSPALEVVFGTARRLAGWTVVDTGFCLEADEELSYDTAAPRRNAATLTTLAEADVVVAVGAGDPVGLQRLLTGLEQLARVGVPDPLVVLTRVRAAVVGRRPRDHLTELLRRHGGITEVTCIPEDRAGYDAALLAGRTLAEQSPGSPAVAAIADLADRVRAHRGAEHAV